MIVVGHRNLEGLKGIRAWTIKRGEGACFWFSDQNWDFGERELREKMNSAMGGNIVFKRKK